jgi:phospho-N-acetylmuramoyl-pentapeptide-transferase
MLLSLANWLQTLSPEFGFFRVFQYLTFRAVMAAMTSLLIGLAFGPWVIRRLTSLKIGQRCAPTVSSRTPSRAARRRWAAC